MRHWEVTNINIVDIGLPLWLVGRIFSNKANVWSYYSTMIPHSVKVVHSDKIFWCTESIIRQNELVIVFKKEQKL